MPGHDSVSMSVSASTLYATVCLVRLRSIHLVDPATETLWKISLSLNN